jgi:hypothetical protein
MNWKYKYATVLVGVKGVQVLHNMKANRVCREREYSSNLYTEVKYKYN